MFVIIVCLCIVIPGLQPAREIRDKIGIPEINSIDYTLLD